MKFLPRRLNIQVILLVSVILSVTGVMSGWMTARRHSDRLTASMQEHSLTMVRNFAENCARSLILQDYAELESSLLKTAEISNINRIQVCEPNGQVIADVSKGSNHQPVSNPAIATITTPPAVSPAILLEDGELVIWQPISAGSMLGWIRVDYSMASIRQEQAETWKQSLLFSLFWVAGSSIILLLVLRPTVNSFSRLTDFAKQLDEHKGAQILVSDRTREITDLAASLNYASAKLLSTEQELVIDRERLRESITELKRSEHEIHHLKNYLSNIIDSMPAVLVGMDRDGAVTQWNRLAEETSGITFAEALGKPFAGLIPDFSPWIEALRNEVRQRHPASMEKLLIEKNGERNFYDVMVYPLVANGVEGAVVRIEDVTERTRIQELMIQTEKMMSVGGLAAGMAHEINNPLGIITQAAQNIERRVSPELAANLQAANDVDIRMDRLTAYLERRQIPEFIAGIREAAARASRIIANILRFSRRADSVMSPVSLPDVMEQALDLAANDYDLKKKFDFRSIEIVRNFASDMPGIPMIETEIEQVLLNLLKNAAQAMIANPPEHKPHIELRIRLEERYAVLEVEDNGPGMTEDVRRRVFEPFFTTKEPGFGTGLGLSVSYMIVTQNHKGLMEVISTPGRGACFTIRLPLYRENNHEQST